MDFVRAEYIPDDIEDIKQTVLRLKERVGPDGVIFSSGGIGPTHDDVTYEALAAAFGMLCIVFASCCSEQAQYAGHTPPVICSMRQEALSFEVVCRKDMACLLACIDIYTDICTDVAM